MRSTERPQKTPLASPSRVRLRAPIMSSAKAIESRNDALIRRLALDRLRDLHDDGVTMEYIGRMYGVSGDRMTALEADLRR